MTSNTTILITGASRGIRQCVLKSKASCDSLLLLGLGRGLAEHYLSQPNNVVIAAVRDPNHPTAKSLSSLPTGSGSSIIIVKVESTSETDADDAMKELTATHSISVLDIVIANAGISRVFPTVDKARIEDIQEHWNVNVIGVIRLFKACFPLLSKANAPKFITLGTSAASMTDMEKRNFPNVAYGTSKAALNYVTLKIHFENPNLTAFPLDPG